MRELGTFLALFLRIAFDVVDAWEPPPYGSVGTNQCLTNNYNPDTYSMVKSYFDMDLAIKYCEITPGCNIVVKIDRSRVRNFQGLQQIYEIGSTKTAPCQLNNYLQGTIVDQVWPVLRKDPGSQDIPLSFKDGWQTKSYTVVKSKQVRTFDEVKAYCDQFGMKMPVPQSKDECKQLGKLAEPTPAGRFYLGIRYDLDEFRDVYDHQAIRFSNWRRGEPNNHRYTLEKEVEMHKDGSWNDREGEGRRITICIKK